MNTQTNPNAAPLFRVERALLFGKLIMLGVTVWAWTIIGGYWMLWAGITAMVGWSIAVTLNRYRLGKLYEQINEQLRFEAETHISGKTTRLVQSGDAIIQTLSGRIGHFIGALDHRLLFYNPWGTKGSHVGVFGRARSGKSSTSCLGTLLNIFNVIGQVKHSVWINDCKAELYFVSSAIRRWLGQRVIALNGFGVKGVQVDTFNPFDPVVDAVVLGNGEAHEWADINAQGMILEEESQRGNDFIFRENARRLLITFILYLACYKPFECNPCRLRQLVMASDDELVAIANMMSNSEKEGGLIKTYGNMLLHDLKPVNQKLFYSFKVECAIAVKIYDDNTAFGRSTMKSTFKLEDLFHPTKKVALYQITPQAYLGTHGAYAALVSTLIIEKMARLDRRCNLMMIFDEAGQIKLNQTTFKKAITLLPSLGLRCILYYQSFSQLKMLGENMSKLVLDNLGCLQMWGCDDPDMAKEFSRRSGQTTVKKRSYRKDPEKIDLSWSLSCDEKEEAVISETEIMQASDETQFVKITGQRMLKCRRVVFWKVRLWRRVAQPNPLENPDGSYPETDTVEWEY